MEGVYGKGVEKLNGTGDEKRGASFRCPTCPRKMDGEPNLQEPYEGERSVLSNVTRSIIHIRPGLSGIKLRGQNPLKGTERRNR